MLFKKNRSFLDSFLKIFQNLESQILENFQLKINAILMKKKKKSEVDECVRRDFSYREENFNQ